MKKLVSPVPALKTNEMREKFGEYLNVLNLVCVVEIGW